MRILQLGRTDFEALGYRAALEAVVHPDDRDRIGRILAAGDGRYLRHGAAPSLPGFYNEAIDGIEIGPAGGSCGTAAYRRRPVAVADIATDPLWAAFRDLAAAAGLGACWSTPRRH